jgi:hypothetical protein
VVRGGDEDQLQKQLEQKVDRKSENIYTSTQGKKLTHVNVFAYISKNHVKFKYQYLAPFYLAIFISSKQKLSSFKYQKRELEPKANSKICVSALFLNSKPL